MNVFNCENEENLESYKQLKNKIIQNNNVKNIFI